MPVMTQRTEALMRVLVLIVSGLILYVWYFLVVVLTIIHWIFVLATGRTVKGMAEFCNLWVTQVYKFLRYITFSTNARPFPFAEMEKSMHPVESKNKKS